MAYVTYTAKRNLKSGHSASTSYSIEFSAEQLTPIFTPSANENRSLGGTTETTFNRLDESWAVSAAFQAQSTYDDWREFFSSVAGGESFTFDAYGTVASPDNAQTVIMEGAPSMPRVGNLQGYKPSFNARVV